MSTDWSKYNQGKVVYRPANMSPEELRAGLLQARKHMFSYNSILHRIPWYSRKAVLPWLIGNFGMRFGTRNPDSEYI